MLLDPESEAHLGPFQLTRPPDQEAAPTVHVCVSGPNESGRF